MFTTYTKSQIILVETGVCFAFMWSYVSSYICAGNQSTGTWINLSPDLLL